MEEKSTIRYRFDVEKFVNAMAYFVQKIDKIDKLKAAKLLYFLDKYHVVNYARPVIGDCYHSLDYGPVPSMSLDIMNDVISGVPLRGPLPNKEMFEKYLRVDDKKSRYPNFVLVQEPDLDRFSESEIEALDNTIKEYGHRSGPKLIELTHKDPTWKAVQNGEIDYSLFVVNSPHRSEILELMKLDQENQQFIDTVNS